MSDLIKSESVTADSLPIKVGEAVEIKELLKLFHPDRVSEDLKSDPEVLRSAGDITRVLVGLFKGTASSWPEEVFIAPKLFSKGTSGESFLFFPADAESFLSGIQQLRIYGTIPEAERGVRSAQLRQPLRASRWEELWAALAAFEERMRKAREAKYAEEERVYESRVAEVKALADKEAALGAEFLDEYRLRILRKEDEYRPRYRLGEQELFDQQVELERKIREKEIIVAACSELFAKNLKAAREFSGLDFVIRRDAPHSSISRESQGTIFLDGAFDKTQLLAYLEEFFREIQTARQSMREVSERAKEESRIFFEGAEILYDESLQRSVTKVLTDLRKVMNGLSIGSLNGFTVAIVKEGKVKLEGKSITVPLPFTPEDQSALKSDWRKKRFKI